MADPVARARLAWFLELSRWWLGDSHGALTRLERVRDVLRRGGDTWGTAVALVSLARTELVQGGLDRARDQEHEAERVLRVLGDRWGILHASHVLAQIAEARGDLEETARRQGEGLRIALIARR
ncbi:hypothetical protein [Nocardiopsis sp. ATB16-24]|uniref:hypothetical protein n=1 Tax=Nocardiopsis sp. ATB16-24 TaxID=3019555 RepID=UPI0025565BF0|nr:hypothetical protein [Nocardiopsis sp. ATB16-24]